ncbi:MAG: hypothetical protein NXH82_03975 [Rhodobacteraceae bacterium]|nr:hypothetical protein [Paracoccaceae bacterium]
MPHAELKYSADLTIDPQAILAEIEAVIARHDPGAGACKGRAHAAPVWNHSHILVQVVMLAKPHRDAAFTETLIGALEQAVKARLTQPCFFSLSLDFNGPGYVTNRFEGHP